MENFSFFQADLETKELGCFSEAGCKALKGSLSMCNKSSVISEEEVSDQLLLGLCVGLKSPEIEEVAIEAIADINAIIVRSLRSSLRSSVACLSIMLKKMEKRVGARTQPCFMLLLIVKGSERSPLSLTWPRRSSCS